ncbi:MAG: hypothetical protein ACLT8H_03925 [Streptococcus parasanguinis]
MKNLSEKFATFSQDFRNVHREAKKQGFVNIMKLLWRDQSIQIHRDRIWVYTLQWSSGLVPNGPKPSRRRWLRWQVSQFQQE